MWWHMYRVRQNLYARTGDGRWILFFVTCAPKVKLSMPIGIGATRLSARPPAPAERKSIGPNRRDYILLFSQMPIVIFYINQGRSGLKTVCESRGVKQKKRGWYMFIHIKIRVKKNIFFTIFESFSCLFCKVNNTVF